MAETRANPLYDRQTRLVDPIKSLLPTNERSSVSVSRRKVLVVFILLPLGSFLLFLSGLTLAGTLIGLSFATPPFIIFSPILVPATFTLALTIVGVLTSRAFAITAVSALWWMVKYLRGSRVPEKFVYAKRWPQKVAAQVGLTGEDAEARKNGQARRYIY